MASQDAIDNSDVGGVGSTRTVLPSCAKAITAGAGFLTGNDGAKKQAMTVHVGVAGTVTVLPVGNDLADTVDFVVPAGGIIPVLCSKVTAVVDAASLVGVF